jgi:phosphatidate cytidylyltransferase
LRTITGLVYVVVIIGSLLLGAKVFASLFFIINLLTLNEFLTNIKRIRLPSLNLYFGIASGAVLYLLITLTGLGYLPPTLLSIALVIPLSLFARELFAKNQSPITNIAISTLGLIYITIPFALLVTLYPTPQSSDPFPWNILALFVIVWINDTFSYLTGITFGRNLLFKRISPKKTWEGTIGGFLSSLAGGFVMYKVSSGYSMIFIYFIGNDKDVLFRANNYFPKNGKLKVPLIIP